MPEDMLWLQPVLIGAVIVFILDLIGNMISFSNRFMNALATAIVFAVVFGGLLHSGCHEARHQDGHGNASGVDVDSIARTRAGDTTQSRGQNNRFQNPGVIRRYFRFGRPMPIRFIGKSS